jgi:hypothetical protein
LAHDCLSPFAVACSHDAQLPWTVEDKSRTTLFFKFNSEAGSWSGEYFDPDDYAKYEDMTPERLRLLEPPNARYGGRPLAKSLASL